jgi:hypothetical protein
MGSDALVVVELIIGINACNSSSFKRRKSQDYAVDLFHNDTCCVT